VKINRGDRSKHDNDSRGRILCRGTHRICLKEGNKNTLQSDMAMPSSQNREKIPFVDVDSALQVCFGFSLYAYMIQLENHMNHKKDLKHGYRSHYRD
jgi:hypothetical protein